MKKFISMLVIISILLATCGCEKENDVKTTTSVSETVVTTSETTVADVSEKTAASTSDVATTTTAKTSTTTEVITTTEVTTSTEAVTTTEITTAPVNNGISVEVIPESGVSEHGLDISDYKQVFFNMADASSYLSDSYMTYAPRFAIDSELTKPWVEGADGDGIGENLTLCYDSEQTIDAICIHPGYAMVNEYKVDTVYYENNRPKEIELVFSDGMTVRCVLPDLNEDIYLRFSEPVTTRYVLISICSVYPGSKYRDTCISEVKSYSLNVSSDNSSGNSSGGFFHDAKKDYHIYFDDDGTLRWDDFKGADSYLVVSTDGVNTSEDYCITNNSVYYSDYMSEKNLPSGVYDLKVYALDVDDNIIGYLGEVPYIYEPDAAAGESDTDSAGGRVYDFVSHVSNYHIEFDEEGTLRWDAYDGAESYRIYCTRGDNWLSVENISENYCHKFIKRKLIDYSNAPSGEVDLTVYASTAYGEVEVASCSFYLARISSKYKEELNGTWYVYSYNGMSPERFYEQYKSVFDSYGWDKEDVYETLIIDTYSGTIIISGVNGVNEYQLELYDNGFAATDGNIWQRLTYNKNDDTIRSEILGGVTIYKRGYF